MADSSTLVDRVKIFVESSGTGPFQLGNAVPAFRGSEALTDGLTYSYAVESGSDYEVGQGVYVLAVDQLLRAPTLSSAGGAPVAFPANVTINFTALAADLTAGLAGTGTVTSIQGSGGTTGMTLTGGPITGAGTLTLGGTLGLANGGTGGTTATEARSGIGLGNVDNTSDADKPVSAAVNDALELRPTYTFLAASTGATSIGFLQNGTDAVLRSIADKLLGFVDVLDFVPDALRAAIRAGTNTTDLTSYVQKAIDSLQTRGGTVLCPSGTYHIDNTIFMRSGVNLRGAGRFIDFSSGVVLSGTWFVYRGPDANPAFNFYGKDSIDFSDIGILCSEVSVHTAFFIGSDNAPAAKRLTWSRYTVVGADVGVEWGNANADNPLEQCDDMTFTEGHFISCGDAFIIDAANAADYSKVTRHTFDNVKRSAVYLKKSAMIRFEDCAAGLLFSTSTMFKITGTGPDPINIVNCQSEAAPGKFLTYVPTSNNDQGQINLEGNTINQPIEINGLARVTLEKNFINSTVSTTGFARLESTADVWDGVFGQPIHTPQILIAAPGQFTARCLKNAVSYVGHWLPNNFHIENGEATAGGFTGLVVTRAGVRCTTFVASAAYTAGQYVEPTADNTHAYLVTVGGTAGAEPSWPTGSGATVTSGTVTFQEVGTNAILKGYGEIAA